MRGRQDRLSAEPTLRDVLFQFWLGGMNRVTAPFPDRVKCSELLARYFLDAGSRKPVSPSSAEVLKLADELGRRGDRHGEESS